MCCASEGSPRPCASSSMTCARAIGASSSGSIDSSPSCASTGSDSTPSRWPGARKATSDLGSARQPPSHQGSCGNDGPRALGHTPGGCRSAAATSTNKGRPHARRQHEFPARLPGERRGGHRAGRDERRGEAQSFDYKPNQRYPDPAVQILDPASPATASTAARVEQVATGMRWAEGPVYFPDGGYLLSATSRTTGS